MNHPVVPAGAMDAVAAARPVVATGLRNNLLEVLQS